MLRETPDSCPDTVHLHEAADGPLARIRIPGGALTPAQLQVLAEVAIDLGDGHLELTSRGNVQVRAVRDAGALGGRLAVAGLLPSRTHERVRNIVASPLSGRVGGWADVRELVREFDEKLCAAAELAELPGRVLFAFDDGRGDVSALSPDIGVHAVDEDTFALVLAGVDTGVRTGDPVGAVLDAAQAYRRVRGAAWRVHEVGAARVLGREPDGVALPDPGAPPIGWLVQGDDGISLAAGVRLGVLPARLAEFLAAVERPVTITPWRSIVVHDLDDWRAEQVVRVLAPMGLIFDAESPWLQVSACTGKPGCAKALADVRADAAAAVAAGHVNGRQHWSGCERRCGKPRDAADVVATADGYRVSE